MWQVWAAEASEKVINMVILLFKSSSWGPHWHLSLLYSALGSEASCLCELVKRKPPPTKLHVQMSQTCEENQHQCLHNLTCAQVKRVIAPLLLWEAEGCWSGMVPTNSSCYWWDSQLQKQVFTVWGLSEASVFSNSVSLGTHGFISELYSLTVGK